MTARTTKTLFHATALAVVLAGSSALTPPAMAASELRETNTVVLMRRELSRTMTVEDYVERALYYLDRYPEMQPELLAVVEETRPDAMPLITQRLGTTEYAKVGEARKRAESQKWSEGLFDTTWKKAAWGAGGSAVVVGGILALSGGSDSSSTSSSGTNDFPIQTPPANFNTTEYRRNTGNEALNADEAYARGFTGEGIVVGVFDDGITQGNVSDEMPSVSFSRNYVGTDVTSGESHSDFIATILAGTKNDMLSHGIAHGATLYDYKISTRSGNFVSGPTIAGAYDNANDDGVFVINASYGSNNANGAPNENSRIFVDSAFGAEINAIRRFQSGESDRGTVIVFSAGNEGRAQPSWESLLPWYYPELEGNLLTVAALDSTFDPSSYDPATVQLAAYSNACGAAMNWCVTAPGTNILTEAADGSSWVISGTSYATPFVVGAVAILGEAYPELTVEEVVEILLVTAEDLGAPGVDPVFGYGLVDLEAAFQPVGQTSTTTASGATYRVEEGDGSLASTRSFAGLAGSALTVPVYDRYDRRFEMAASQLLDRDASARRLASRIGRMLDGASVRSAGNLADGTRMLTGSASQMTETEQSYSFTGNRAELFEAGDIRQRLSFGLSGVEETGMGLRFPLGDGLTGFSEVGAGKGYIYAAPGVTSTAGPGQFDTALVFMHETGSVLGETGSGLFEMSGTTVSAGLVSQYRLDINDRLSLTADAALVRVDYRGRNDFVTDLQGTAARAGLTASYATEAYEGALSLESPLHYIGGTASTSHYAPRVGLINDKAALSQESPLLVNLKASMPFFRKAAKARAELSYAFTDSTDPAKGRAEFIMGFSLDF